MVVVARDGIEPSTAAETTVLDHLVEAVVRGPEKVQ